MKISHVKRFNDARTLLTNHNIGWTHTLQYVVLTRADSQSNYVSPLNHFMDGDLTQVAQWDEDSCVLYIFDTPCTRPQSFGKNYIPILNTEKK